MSTFGTVLCILLLLIVYFLYKLTNSLGSNLENIKEKNIDIVNHNQRLIEEVAQLKYSSLKNIENKLSNIQTLTEKNSGFSIENISKQELFKKNEIELRKLKKKLKNREHSIQYLEEQIIISGNIEGVNIDEKERYKNIILEHNKEIINLKKRIKLLENNKN